MAPRRTTFAIVIAFFAVILAFITSGILADSQLAQLDVASHRLTATTLPRLEHLISIRSTLRSLDVLLDDYVDAVPPARAVTASRIERAIQQLETDGSTVAALNPDGGTEPRTLARDAEALAGVTGRMLSRSRMPSDDELRAMRDRDVHPAITAVDLDARTMLEQTTQSAESIATRIGGVRSQTQRATMVLDAVCVVLAVLAAVVLERTVRRYTDLLVEHGRVVEARAAELEQFSARVAHDILSPLTAVSFGVAHAKRSVESDGAKRSLERAMASVDRVRAIVDGLYEFARSGAKPDPGAKTDVATVIEGVVEELRPRADEERVLVHLEPIEPCAVACARGVLASIVQNLARNAVKYIDGGADRRVTIRARASATHVRIEVADTGPGIPEGAEARIFDPYVRASTGKRGIGLGLATVKRLATAHGGSVGVSSRPGAGCVFWVDLPRAA